MSRSALVVRHVAFEDLGLLEPLLRRRRYSIDYLDAGVDDIDSDEIGDVDLLIVLGGPIGLTDIERYPYLTEEVDLIRRRVDTELPTLGICLGAQLLAVAAGAEVKAGQRPEIGFAPLELADAGRASVLASLQDQAVLHWHGDEFGIPTHARRLAGSDEYRNQAFDIGPNILALQFHLEVTPGNFERWLIGHSHELRTVGIDPRDLREQLALHGSTVAATGSAVLGAWLDQLEPRAAGKERRRG